MPIFDLYSKRQKLIRGEVPDIFVYNEIPHTLRIQIIHIMRDSIGFNRFGDNATVIEVYEHLCNILRREYGCFTLDSNADNYEQELLNFMIKSKDYEKVLDVIELTFKYIDKVIRPDFDSFKRKANSLLNPDQAISDLNDRFKEASIGYSFENGILIRIDSTFIHAMVTKPTLSLLHHRKLTGANEEYLKAHEHFRNGQNKECIAECLKAFESTLKIICKEKGWQYSENDTAKTLVKKCFDNELVPIYTQNQFTSLQNLLESGIPPIRNRLGGHGQGQLPKQVSSEITRYALNLTATNIIFLVELSGIK